MKCVSTVVLKKWKLDKKMNIHWMRGKEMKTLFETSIEKEPLCATHAIFTTKSSRVQVAKASRQNTWKKTFEKFSKCFSWLEVPLARESRSEPQKSLCTLHDWTFHPRTSRQHESRITWKPRFLKNILSLFRDWSIYPPMSHQWVAKNLCMGSRLGHAIGPTHDWVTNTGQHCFWNFDKFFVKTKYIPKTTKTLKNLFVIDQQRLSMWKHI